MNRKRLGFILIGGGVAIACVVGVLVYLQVSAARAAIAQLPTRSVIVAFEDIPSGSQIKASQIQSVLVPDQAIPANSATAIDDSVVGKYTPDTILKGQVVILTEIGDESTRGIPSYQLDRGQVLYAMETQLPNQQPLALTAVNALRAGDRVDFVYSTLVVPQEFLEDPEKQALLQTPIAAQYLTTRVLLQNIRIEALGVYQADGTFLNDPKYMIFKVSPEEALVLKWLKDAAIYIGNTIEHVLKAPADQDSQPDPSLEINVRYMREKYGLPEPPVIDVNR